MKEKITVLFIMSVFIVLQSACRRTCKEGCDTLLVIDGAALNFSDTIVSLSSAESSTSISFDPIIHKQNGDRNCKYENKITCTQDGLEANKLSLYCNKDLVLNGITYPMNTDLLEVTELVKSSADPTQKLPFVVLLTTPTFPKGRYHFLLQGKTNEGKDVEDIGVISWE